MKFNDKRNAAITAGAFKKSIAQKIQHGSEVKLKNAPGARNLDAERANFIDPECTNAAS